MHRHVHSYRVSLDAILTPFERKHAVYSFDVLGTMALIEIPKELQKKKKKIARTLLDTHAQLNRVYEKIGEHSGKYRVEKIRWLAGEKNPVAHYTEWGCTFSVHPGKVFFNPRLSTERQRVVMEIKPAQSVAVFFSGVGPYPILIAKHQRPSRVYAIEWNKSAQPFVEENIRRNKVVGKIVPIWGDVEKVPVLEKCDHVVMPAPDTAISYLSSALRWCKPKGKIHLYLFVDASSTIHDVYSLIQKKGFSSPSFRILSYRKVSDFSARKQQWCVILQPFTKKASSFNKKKRTQ
ncbi:MAG: hypothetical protein V1776_04875 [Candidatus Diapherotrites archaeon]